MDRQLMNICLRLRQLDPNITNLRLQKLLYFIQAVFLVQFRRVAYTETIEAWPYGPVVPEAYFSFKRGEIIETAEMIPLEDDLEATIITVHEAFLSWTDDFSLVNLTHSYETWKTVWNSYGGKEISPENILRYHTTKQRLEGAIL